jgi:adenylate cyclase
MGETRKLAAIMAVDVVGYSRLMSEDEAGTATAVREHRRAAHVTNSMAQHGGDDFEKGEGQGTVTALRLIEAATRAFRSHAQRRF